jgi:hypothetical protein
MGDIGSSASPRSVGYSLLAGSLVVIAAIAVVVATQPSAGAAATPVGLGNATPFAILAGSTVTNTGPSTINGDLGVSPGTAVTGFGGGGGTVTGTIHAGDTTAANAQTDLTTAYNDAAAQTPATSVGASIGGGQTLLPGVYNSTSSLGVTGSLTLDAGGDPNAVFVFQAGSTLITDPGTTVILTNGAQACNVFWQVGSSATLDTTTTFQGSVLALTSISVNNGATISGRLLARNGAVTLINDTVTVPTCTTASPSPSASPSTTVSPSPTTSPTVSPSPTASPTESPTTPTSSSPMPSPSSSSPMPTKHHHHHGHGHHGHGHHGHHGHGHGHHAPAPRPTPIPTTFPVTG